MDSTADQAEPTGTPSPASSRTIAPADHPATFAASPATLTFVLPATDKDGTDHFAVTTFPESYEDAAVVAGRVLGSYMTDPRPENLILRCSIKDRNGNWAWADVDPLNWKLVGGHYNNEVGVFERKVKNVVGDLCFLHGKVYLTGKYINIDRASNWSSLRPSTLKDVIGYPTIDRPKSFNEAVEYVKTAIRNNNLSEFSRNKKDEMVGADNSRFSFYEINSLKGMNPQTWTAFFPLAYTDPQLWREVVPLPGGVLGVGFDEN